jgi:hypothetical protein
MLPILLGKTCGEEHRPCSWVTMEQEETREDIWWVIKLLVAWVESRNTRLASIKKSSCACKHNDAYCTSRDHIMNLAFCYHWIHLPQQNTTLSSIELHDYIEVFFKFSPKKISFCFKEMHWSLWSSNTNFTQENVIFNLQLHNYIVKKNSKNSLSFSLHFARF